MMDITIQQIKDKLDTILGKKITVSIDIPGIDIQQNIETLCLDISSIVIEHAIRCLFEVKDKRKKWAPLDIVDFLEVKACNADKIYPASKTGNTISKAQEDACKVEGKHICVVGYVIQENSIIMTKYVILSGEDLICERNGKKFYLVLPDELEISEIEV